VSAPFGAALPSLVVPPPGPRSRALARELARFESPNVTYLAEDFPVFWQEARGANVRDVDGNVYVDLTAGFAVASAGHGHPAIVQAVTRQAETLLHGMGDVHPPAVKVELLRALAEIAPGGLCRAVLANSGAEAVEAALKTVAMATRCPRVLAFRGSYHGLTLGALSVSGQAYFRDPFAEQLPPIGIFGDFPRREPWGGGGSAESELETVRRILDSPEGKRVGAILAEPLQGRGGDIVPPDDWLPGLRRICDERGLLLVLDEIYTGFGRTGRWFACEHWNVVPDLLVVGKALTGGLPFAACIGTEEVFAAWPRSRGEALHTSTFLGHPLGCAAALASMRVLREEGLVERAAREGTHLLERLRSMFRRHPRIADVRGMGMMIGIEVVHDRQSRDPAPELVGRAVVEAMRRGYLLLGGGVHGNVISLSPPLSIQRAQLNGAVGVLGEVIG
jgi:4-aminobutyrate aminotransferase-like enzyme